MYCNIRPELRDCPGCLIGGWGAALFFLGMGLVALVVPGRVVAIFGGRAETPASRSEVRAVYGGFGVGAAVLTVYAMFSTTGEAAGWLQCLAVAMASMAAGRVVGGVVERGQNWYPTWAFVVVELALATALFFAGGGRL